MDYEVIKIEQKVVTKPGRNLNTTYCNITIEDEDGETREVPVFDKEAERYAPFVGKENELPEKLKQWKFCLDEEFVFPDAKPMVRVNDKGQPELNKFGQMYLRSSVIVFTRYKHDPQWALVHPGESPYRPKKGWDVVSRGTSVMNAFYVPQAAFTVQAGPAPQGAPTFDAPAQQGAPTAQQPPVKSPV